jgi:hypothetical protein
MKGRRCRDDYLSDILKNDFRLKCLTIGTMIDKKKPSDGRLLPFSITPLLPYSSTPDL